MLAWHSTHCAADSTFFPLLFFCWRDCDGQAPRHLSAHGLRQKANNEDRMQVGANSCIACGVHKSPGMSLSILLHSYLLEPVEADDVWCEPAGVKRTALMVLSHLILNDMMKVKGHIARIALCLQDPDASIASMAQLFFHELARRASKVLSKPMCWKLT